MLVAFSCYDNKVHVHSHILSIKGHNTWKTLTFLLVPETLGFAAVSPGILTVSFSQK